MIYLFKVTLVVAFFQALLWGAAQAAPVLTPAAFRTVYVPGGFDSNDNVQFVGEGLFKNTCYRPAKTNVSVDHAKKVITVGPVAYEYPGFCLQVILPFDRVVDVGILKPGTYSVVQKDGSALGSVKVSQARTQEPDDHLYAPISQAFFRQKGLKSEVMLTGNFLGSCMRLDQVKVTVDGNVIVLQPIVKIEETSDCQRGLFPFNKLVEIDMIPAGRYLLHVRSMNAKAVNTLVDVIQ